MPKLGADMTHGTLVTWHKQPGDTVQRGDVIAEVDTEKGVIDVEIFTQGVIEKLLIEPGRTVPVGTPMAIVRDDHAAPAGATVQAPATVAGRTSNAEQVLPVDTEPGSPTSMGTSPHTSADIGRLRISPAARRRARELGVDPARISGSGRGGAITMEDIEAARGVAPRASTSAATPDQLAPAPAAVAAVESSDRFARLRKTIAAAMSRSKREIPHYYLSTTVDLKSALDWLAQQNASRPIAARLLPGVLFLKAVALALRDVPELNAVWDIDHISLQPDIHVGVAISLRQGGLVAPAIHHVDRLSLDELMAKFRDLVNRVRAGSLRSSEMSDPTITVTSLGEQGVEAVYGVIYPPQVALVGFGKVVERPWSVAGTIVSRPTVTATLSADHRVTDGHRGAQFLAAVERRLQEPDKL